MTQYAHDGGAHELRLFQWNPSADEIAAVLAGAVELGFEDYSELCYLTSRLTKEGRCSRTPISHWLLPTPPCPLPEPNSPLRIILIDAQDGTVKAIGTVELPAPMDARLHQLLTAQASQPTAYLTMDELLRSTRSTEMTWKGSGRKGSRSASARLKTPRPRLSL